MMRWDGQGSGGQPGNRALRLLVADRQPLVGAALGAWLGTEGHHVCAQANDQAGLLTALELFDVDIALIDIDLAGAESTPMLCQRGIAAIVLAPMPGHPGLAALLAAGIAGLVLKSDSADLLRLCLASVAAGGRWIDASAQVHITERAQLHKDALHLTRRERDVARLVATGQRNRAIAGALGISEGTVKMHLHNVFAKLGLESRTQLAMDERARAG